MTKKELLDDLIRDGYLKTSSIIKAFEKIDRKDFVPEKIKNLAYENNPLPIGRGQTISQPLTVAFMLELLSPEPAQKILDIGFGSGWTAALLAYLVGEKGKVFGMEIIPELYEFGKINIGKYPFKNVELFNKSGGEGFPEEAPFDKILVSAAAAEIPQALKSQLKIGGKMVIPIKNSIYEIERKGESEFTEKEHFGFSFVPLVKD